MRFYPDDEQKTLWFGKIENEKGAHMKYFLKFRKGEPKIKKKQEKNKKQEQERNEDKSRRNYGKATSS